MAAVWLVAGLVNSAQTVIGLRAEGINRPVTAFFLANTLSWVPWALATPLIMRLAWRFPPNAGSGIAGWACHLAAYFLMVLTHSCWMTVLQTILQPFGAPANRRPFYVDVSNRFLGELFLDLFVYAAVVATGLTLESRRRLALREAQLAEAQLSALRHQLQPHFLFNTLNAISGLVRDRRNEDAVGMIAGLGDLLRRVADDGNRQEAALGEEVEFLERYLDIQRMRFGGRLHASVDVPRELYAAQVPAMILQPIVENAIRHGVEKLVEGGSIQIMARGDGHELTLSVRNEGPALPPDWDLTRVGVGLSNTRARIETLYGSGGGISLRNHAAGGVEAVIVLPYRTAHL